MAMSGPTTPHVAAFQLQRFTHFSTRFLSAPIAWFFNALSMAASSLVTPSIALGLDRHRKARLAASNLYLTLLYFICIINTLIPLRALMKSVIFKTHQESSMATKAPAATPAAKGGTKTITRKRRNSLERKCLPKYLKTMFSGSTHAQFKSLLIAWKESRKKVSARDSG
jgi:hypothetical protein